MNNNDNIVKDIVQNVNFPFLIKSNDFKELNLKALNIKKWIDENWQELAEFIYRHRNYYNTTGYPRCTFKRYS
ncbi:hypothetical protein [Spiroplasma phoeniceum]|uniref:Uncharacterized protein n=1 Tax=Spiroplasma phoeniceum P40 TaxID=1276259 RepID=A0A345DS93_9MOLU|nr:hypothetical protein [Spiroplasma phoeniceum]AXF97084.1 hypothetical protein SDAV_002151 [Spiroplasma phoeniceum P40]